MFDYISKGISCNMYFTTIYIVLHFFADRVVEFSWVEPHHPVSCATKIDVFA